MRWNPMLVRPTVWGAGVALISLVGYTLTMSPTVGFIDSGELATVATTLGIAHPTGYPLFTLLGWIAAHIPLGSEEIVRLNAMAAVFTAGAVYLLFLVAFRLASQVARKVQGQKRMEGVLVLSASAGGTAMLAFSKTFWSQAVAVEVYSLHLLMIGAILLAYLRAREERAPGLWYAVAFFVGLSFSNHMTTILLVPGLLAMYFMEGPSGTARWRTLVRSSYFFVLGLTPYMYLPLRAAQSPVMDWGNPATFSKLLAHMSGKQYSVWIFSSTDVAVRQFSYFLSSVPGEFAVIGLVFAVIGLVALWRAHRTTALGTMVMFVTCIAYAVNYDIHDIDSYFLLAFVCIGLWGACGLFVVGEWLGSLGAWGKVWAPVVVAVLGLVPAYVHFREVDESHDFLVEDYTRNMFASLRPGAVILSFQWDYWVSASHYYQLVRGERPDIAVIDKELLRRSWYFRVLEKRYPWLVEESRAEVDAFLKELYKFEQNLPYVGQVIEARYAAMIQSFIAKSMVSRPVYVTPEIESEYTRLWRRDPEGLAYRLVGKDAPENQPSMPSFSIRPFNRAGRLEGMFWRLYGEAYAAVGTRFQHFGEVGLAQEAFARAASVRIGDTRGSGLGSSRH
jgi:hypothetical protein